MGMAGKKKKTEWKWAVETEVDATMKLVKHVMEKAPEPVMQLTVPLQVDARAAGRARRLGHGEVALEA